jgi:hypothetical protein
VDAPTDSVTPAVGDTPNGTTEVVNPMPGTTFICAAVPPTSNSRDDPHMFVFPFFYKKTRCPCGYQQNG